MEGGGGSEGLIGSESILNVYTVFLTGCINVRRATPHIPSIVKTVKMM